MTASLWTRRRRSVLAASVLQAADSPTGLASRFDNGNPHGFSGFVEANSRCYLSQCFVAASAKRLNRKRISRRVD